MIYKYKVSRKTLLKLKLVLFFILIILGVFILAINSRNDEYPIIGILMGASCLIAATIDLYTYCKLKRLDEVDDDTKKKDSSTCSLLYSGLSENPEEIINTLITNNVLYFNRCNNSHVVVQEVIDFFFRKYNKEIPKLSIKDIYNKHFGYKTYIYMCCIMLSDKSYAEMKKQFSSDFEIVIPKKEKETINKEFYQIMDEAYVDKNMELLLTSLDKADDIESISEESLSGVDIICETVKHFMEKYHLRDESFIKEKQKNSDI